MLPIGTEILIISVLILANGLFTMSEMALVTARKARLHDWARQGNARAKTALDLASKPNSFLSSVQIGITLIGVLVGAFGGRTVADWVAGHLAALPVVEPYSAPLALGLVVVVITYLTLVIGELVPKRMALRYPETIATFVALPLRLLSKISFPIVHLLNASTEAVCRIFGRHNAEEPPVTEEEVKIMVQQGTDAGVFEEQEQDMVEAVLRLGDKTARSLMTPRTQIEWLDLNDPIDQLRDRIIQSVHSRFPVGVESLDNVTGIVRAKDMLGGCLTGKPIELRGMVQQPLFVPRTVPALEILELFKQSGKHIALVVDEYGGIEGLLTHHDILEAIAGDMPFSEKPTDPKAVKRHDGSWLLDGMLTIDEFKEIFGIDSLPGEKRDAYQTLGGFVFTQMGRVPTVGDHFEWQGLRFEVVDMDGKRIDKVLVMNHESPAAVPAENHSTVRKQSRQESAK
jgi:putative hemolysin